MMKRAAVVGMAATALILSACGQGGGSGTTATQGDMAMGAAEGAKVTVVEYASTTCAGCAAWNETVWPDFKAKYVDNDKVRFVFREFPTPPQDVAVAGFLIARCAGDDKYFEVVDHLMRSQTEMRNGVPPRDILLRTAQAAGLSEAQFQECTTDKAAVAALEQRIKQASAAGVTGTPTFMVNGQIVTDNSLSGLSASIDPLL
ncbi:MULTISPECIES: DsbA family protein [Brevundimonas]|jgi:protein-disulfide isomerase|uniref:DsbA family protein n=1 Tax=Brevundimonas TaxID=41275 RepID=UPI0019075EDF|nr:MULTISPECIES: DsbA family protein [Brevundimonas]MBK1968497.1 DsbA family protein [Brevundimonas diminuta]MBK1976148.1 DsbA family protein [Brevundimonas diminuta]MDA1322878.1 DsbA family protein [Pseudomonadota bacterium]MDM8353636.1 DsbA family protein [Brevundimonas diminuta]